MSDGLRFYYESRGQQEAPGIFYVIDPTASKRVLFDSKKVAAFLSKATASKIDASPGDKSVPQYDFTLLDIVHRTVVRVDVPPTGLVLRPAGAEWSPDSHELFVLSSDRGFKEVRLSLVNAATGEAKPIIKETSKTFVEMSNGDDDTIVAIVRAGEDIIWFSERDGWGHLYRYAKDGTLKNQIEQGDYSGAELIRVDRRRSLSTSPPGARNLESPITVNSIAFISTARGCST